MPGVVPGPEEGSVKPPRPVRVLGACGLIAAALTTLGGFIDCPALVGASGAVMFVANIYCLFSRSP